jgi:hypothetical protein
MILYDIVEGEKTYLQQKRHLRLQKKRQHHLIDQMSKQLKDNLEKEESYYSSSDQEKDPSLFKRVRK